MTKFSDLGLSEALLKAISDVGFEEPTPVQTETIPILLEGRDLIAQAQTGTGKTAAFALPILDRLVPGAKDPQALVLAPTRELAIQVAQTFHQLGKTRNTRALAIYGGQPISRQLRALQYPVDVIVGTPGRIMDHMRRETMKLDSISMLILDEADEMLNMGFIEDIEWILERIPSEHQTALFSATMPDRIARLARRYMKNAARVAVKSEKMTVKGTEQSYYEVVQRAKVEALTRILDLEMPDSAIIFCRTKREVDNLAQQLQSLGYAADSLHGDLNQTQRDRVMARFRSGQDALLVATDVAARGLDVENVTHVINYDLPGDPENYVHRIGRTGRAGRTGVAITLVTPRERRLMSMIERATGQKITRRNVPTQEQVVARQYELLGASLIEVIEQDELEPAMRIVDDLSAYHEPHAIAAAAVKLLMKDLGTAEERGMISDEALGEAGMTRLYLSVGRRDGVRPMDVVGAIANEAQIPGKSIGQIEITDTHTLVEVPEPVAERVIRALGRTRLRGKAFTVDLAKPPGK
ncbi:DEAD/DEAH box helicase [soil metagenome]|jgi:ATP-dependent RNA helicase DeaD